LWDLNLREVLIGVDQVILQPYLPFQSGVFKFITCINAKSPVGLQPINSLNKGSLDRKMF